MSNLETLPDGWTIKDERLYKIFHFADFPAAIGFMVQASFHCEAVDHHPNWENIYNKLIVKLFTHDVGKLTQKDFDLADYLNGLYHH